MDFLRGAEQLGINPWLFGAVFVWSAIWKMLALWKSAKKGSVIWFVGLFLINTLGILEILYIFIFSEMKFSKPKKSAAKRKRRR